MSAWVLPDHIADVLPSEARHIEELRRGLLDTARSYGYELVMPPLLEYLESLLTGTGEALNLQTFKLVDQISGRSLGLRSRLHVSMHTCSIARVSHVCAIAALYCMQHQIAHVQHVSLCSLVQKFTVMQALKRILKR